jgi:hypothetical protein
MSHVRHSSASFASKLRWAAVLMVFFAYIAVRLGTDGTPDFKLYHYYNGYAALSDRSSRDLVPAQLQTFRFPWLDTAYYLLFRGLNSHPTLLNIILSLPYAVAAWMVFLIGNMIVPGDWPWRRTTAGIAAVYGATGAGSLPTLATTMSDVVPGVFMLVALWISLKSEQRKNKTNLAPTLAGLTSGFSVALKLTIAPLFIALGLVILLARLERPSRSLIATASYGISGAIVILLVDGPWLLHNYKAYGNPLFPMFNDLFKSDYADHSSWMDDRFYPKSMLMAFFYPAYWAFTLSHDAIELDMQDSRILLALVSALAIILGTVMYKNSKHSSPKDNGAIPSWNLAVFFIVAYVLWEYQFSIYRYLMVLEFLTGVIAIAALRECPGFRSNPVMATVMFFLVVATSAALTRYPWWSRAIPTAHAVEINLPQIELDAMVVLLDPYVYAYLVPSLPNTVRVVGANNNIVRPGSWGKLQAQVAAAITDHRGPLWGIEHPVDFPGVANQTLTYYRLARGEYCTFIETNIEQRIKMRMCRLVRD